MIFTFMQFSLGDAFNYPVFGKCRQPNKQTDKQMEKKKSKLMNCNAVGKKMPLHNWAVQ